MAITTSGTSITFNDATVQTTAFTGGGGVTSLNGQTGAITNTTLDSIGSVVIAAYGGTSNITNGTTVAGSSLYYPNTVTRAAESGTLYSNGTSSTGPRFDNTTQWTNSNGLNDNRGYASLGLVARTTSGNTGWSAPLGASTLSGTWRCMGFVTTRTSRYTNNCCGSWTVSSAFITLWVRVS
jgi:hypothetical protein